MLDLLNGLNIDSVENQATVVMNNDPFFYTMLYGLRFIVEFIVEFFDFADYTRDFIGV